MTGDKTSCPRLGSVLRCRLCAVRRPDGETVHVTRFLDARRTATAKDPGFACTASAAPSGRYGLMTPERWGFIPQSRASLVLLVNSIRSACAIGTPTSWVFDDHAAWSASWCVSSLTDCLVESYSTAAELVWMDSALRSTPGFGLGVVTFMYSSMAVIRSGREWKCVGVVPRR